MARILVIDESPVAAAALGRWLRIDGHETRAVSRFVEVADTLEEFLPDVLIVDLQMQGFDGVQLARLLHRTRRGAPPIILYSGGDDAKLGIPAGTFDAFDVVSKLGPNRDIRLAVARALAAATLA